MTLSEEPLDRDLEMMTAAPLYLGWVFLHAYSVSCQTD
jgi:hypothetical protein